MQPSLRYFRTAGGIEGNDRVFCPVGIYCNIIIYDGICSNLRSIIFRGIPSGERKAFFLRTSERPRFFSHVYFFRSHGGAAC